MPDGPSGSSTWAKSELGSEWVGGVYEGKYIRNQFTGIKDKSGDDVYESDVVKIGKKICGVVYLDHSMKFFFDVIKGNTESFIATPDNIKIIGTIYQSTKLSKLK